MQTKICTKCRKEKPATSKYFYKMNHSKDGFQYKCKECVKKYDKKQKKQYYYDNKEKILKYKKEHYIKNKNQYKQKNKEYYINNVETFLINRKKYYENNKEKIAKNDKKYYIVNKDKIMQNKREYFNKNKRKIYDYHIRYNQKRRALKNSLPSTFTDEQWEECKNYFNYKCCYCGKEKKLEQEHFIPLSNGGEYTFNNIISSCKNCNCSKNDSDFFEWYQQQSFYDKKREEKILKYLNYDTKTKIQQLALM